MVYKVGIIGCGWIGCGRSKFTPNIKTDNHAQAYIDCPDTELVALCDVDFVKVNSFYTKLRDQMDSSAYFGLRYIGNTYKEILDWVKPDIISVCTPPETHCRIVCDIAPYVKAIYCEKPIATNLEDADKMIETCRKYNVILQINHQRRFTIPKFKFSRDIIDTGTHVFDLLRQRFGEAEFYEYPYIKFGAQLVEIEYIPTMDEHIFELDCTHNKEPMILKGVQHLVGCLKNHKRSISSGEDGREALYLALKFKEVYERNK